MVRPVSSLQGCNPVRLRVIVSATFFGIHVLSRRAVAVWLLDCLPPSEVQKLSVASHAAPPTCVDSPLSACTAIGEHSVWRNVAPANFRRWGVYASLSMIARLSSNSAYAYRVSSADAISVLHFRRRHTALLVAPIQTGPAMPPSYFY